MLVPNLKDVKNTLQEYPFPVDVIIEVTNYCNLRCVMCPYPTLKREKGEMDFLLFKKIVDEIVEMSPETKIWLAIMGEPLLLGDRLVEMIKYAKSKKIHVNLNTNAVYLELPLAKKIIKAGVDYIIISLDGFSEKSYKQIRIGGNYNKVVNNLQATLEYMKEKKFKKTTIIAQFIEMEANEHEVEDYKEFWLKHGAVVKIRPKLGWGDAVESKILDDLSIKTERFPCSWLTRTVSIHWDGTFAQCDADYEGKYSPGNLNDNTIKEIWDGEIANRRTKHWNHDFDFEPCKNCKDWLAGRSYFYYPDNYARDNYGKK